MALTEQSKRAGIYNITVILLVEERIIAMPGPNQKGASAPEFDLDAAGKDSFHSWYRSLPQVCVYFSFFPMFMCFFSSDGCATSKKFQGSKFG